MWGYHSKLKRLLAKFLLLFTLIQLSFSPTIQTSEATDWDCDVEPQTPRIDLEILNKASDHIEVMIWICNSVTVTQKKAYMLQVPEPAHPVDSSGVKLNGVAELDLKFDEGVHRCPLGVINGTVCKKIRCDAYIDITARPGNYTTQIKMIIDSIGYGNWDIPLRLTIIVKPSYFLAFIYIYAGSILCTFITLFIARRREKSVTKIYTIVPVLSLIAAVGALDTFLAWNPRFGGGSFWDLLMGLAFGFGLGSVFDKLKDYLEGQKIVTIPEWAWKKAVSYFETHETNLREMKPPITSPTKLITLWIEEKTRPKRKRVVKMKAQ